MTDEFPFCKIITNKEFVVKEDFYSLSDKKALLEYDPGLRHRRAAPSAAFVPRGEKPIPGCEEESMMNLSTIKKLGFGTMRPSVIHPQW